MRSAALFFAAWLGAVPLLPQAHAFATLGRKWNSPTVTMHLQLGANATPLLDGSESFGATAEDALSNWNGQINATKFAVVRDSTVTRAARNGLNNVYFSNTVSGQAWGTGVLAVTLSFSSGSVQTETDVLFNGNLTWNSYRGSTRTSNGTILYDLHRVALHEFGHSLGLDHPDTAGQTVSALMNSRISSLDALTSDDIAGAQSLYGVPTTASSPPTIITQPASRSVSLGQGTTFTVAANSPTALGYQWLKNGTAIGGATTTSYTIASVASADAGNYAVNVSNGSGTVTSATAVLTVLSAPTTPTTPSAVAPTIASAPVSQTVAPGATASFSVTATGTTPLSYQWRKDGTAIGSATASVLTLSNVQPAHAGNYSVTISNRAGSVTTATATLNVSAAVPPAPPIISNAPVAQTTNAGQPVTLAVGVSGAPPFSYQWLKDGKEIAGATLATLTLTVRPADAGSYTVQVTNNVGTTASAAAVLTVLSSRLINLSTRAFIPAGGTLTPGFYIRGTGSKSLLIRAVGPTLRRFGIESALPEARLELLAQGSTTPFPRNTANQALVTADTAGGVGAFPLDPNAKDDSVEANLAPQGYTVRITPGSATMTGVSLAEIYDADSPTSFAQLVNVSTLGFVGSGENVLTAGFVVSGNAPKHLLIRAVGPGLAGFGLGGLLPDPLLAIMPQTGTEPLALNDNWSNADAMQAAFQNAGAFALQPGSKDAALLITLEPGAYTAIVSSVTANISGQALVEIYDLDP